MSDSPVAEAPTREPMSSAKLAWIGVATAVLLIVCAALVVLVPAVRHGAFLKRVAVDGRYSTKPIEPRWLADAMEDVLGRHYGHMFDEVESYVLDDPELTDADLEHIVRYPPSQLLQVQPDRITPGGLQEIAPRLKLKKFGLATEELNSQWVDAIVALQPTEALVLWLHRIHGAGLDKLAQLRTLKYLSVSMHSVEEGFLAAVSRIPSLEKLYIESHVHPLVISDDAFKHIGEMGKLKELSLRNCSISETSLRHFEGLKRLECLELTRVPFAGSDLVYLQGMDSLRELRLGGLPVFDKDLVNLQLLPRLEILDLRSTHVTDEGLKQLEKIKSLRFVKVSNTKVTEPAIHQFIEARPDVEVSGSGGVASGSTSSLVRSR